MAKKRKLSRKKKVLDVTVETRLIVWSQGTANKQMLFTRQTYKEIIRLCHTLVQRLTLNLDSVNIKRHSTKGQPCTQHFCHILKLKDDNIHFDVTWSIKARGHAFSSGSKACDLCLTEKFVILTANQNTMLNKRDELLETCQHRRKHLLVSVKDATNTG